MTEKLFEVVPCQIVPPPPSPPPPQPVPPPVQPVPPSSYYPVAGGGSLLNYLCFSADTLVTTLDGTKKPMDDLKINDWILSGNSENGNLGFSKVSAWIHKKPNLKAEFIKFCLKNGQHLKITKMHYIFKGNCKSKKGSFENLQMVFAQNVSIHDCLYTINSKNELIETRISSIEKVQEKGIYAPLTETGTIIVNDIFASCNVDAKHLQFSLPSFTEFVKYISSFFYSRQISSSPFLKSFSIEYDLMPGFKFFATILKDVLPNKY
uniref:Hint domain-containing protein n=1 Tax=Panagrolaimus davidi TaxID=227884 RepID=A0A914P5A4_9BILA